MSRRLFTFLVAVSIFLECPLAFATRPKLDLIIHITNSAGVPVEVCNSLLTFCEKFDPNVTKTDAYATEGHQGNEFSNWVSIGLLRGCGVTSSLKNFVKVKNVENQRNKKIYHVDLVYRDTELHCKEDVKRNRD